MNRILSVAAVMGVVIFGLGLVCSDASAADWQVLFDGKDLSAWQNAGGGEPGKGWVIKDQAMVRTQGAGDIWSKARFGDFVLELEFQTDGNSGVFFRTDNPRNCVQTGIEMQVLQPAGNPGKHSCGAMYDLLAPTKEASKAGEWNHVVITAKDNKITVEMNGEQIIDMDLNQWTEARQNPDGSRNKFGTALKDFKREGHIGFQDHGGNVMYRNVKIKGL